MLTGPGGSWNSCVPAMERLNMSIQLKAVTVFYLADDAKGTGHDGKPYLNPDFKKGQICALDVDGNLYRNIDSQSASEFDPDSWPRKDMGVISLFRDYWRSVTNSPDAPYYDSVIKAPRITLR